MNQNNRSQQTEKLLKVLDSHPNQFASKIMKHIANKIKYIYNRRDNVTQTVLIELLYIAKTRPDAFKLDDVIRYLSNIESPLPKGLATTLFMIYGQIYKGQTKPPLIMAHLFFRDVMGAQEFCHFERAKTYIQGIQLLYFSHPSLLSPKTSLELCKFWNLPSNYYQWEPNLAIQISEIQQSVQKEITKISGHPADPHYADLLYFFMTMINAQDMFIHEFPYLAKTFPQYIPLLFQAAEFFLVNARPEDPKSTTFASRFAQLNPQICVEDYSRTLNEIISGQPAYYSVISNPQGTQYQSNTWQQNEMNTLQGVMPTYQMQPGMNQRANTDEQRLLAVWTSPNFSDYLRDLYKYYQVDVHRPPLANASSLLKRFLYSIQLKSQEDVIRISKIFECILKYTKYSNTTSANQNLRFFDPNIDYKELCDLISYYIQFIANVSTSLLIGISKDVLVPVPLKEQGLPFKQDALRLLINSPGELPQLHQFAYIMITAAARFQFNCLRNKGNTAVQPVIGNSLPEISNNILRWFQKSRKVVALGCLLLVVSPSDIGAKLLNCSDMIKPYYLEFLREFLGRKNDETLINDLDYQTEISETNLNELAHLRYLSPDLLLQCRNPNYLEFLFKNEDFAGIVNQLPLYIMKITPDLIEFLDFAEQAKYIFAHLVRMAMERDNVLVSEIYTNPEIIFWTTLLIQKRPPDYTDQLKYYVQFFDIEKINNRSIRVGTFVMILLLNCEFVYQKNEFTSRNLSDKTNQTTTTTIYQDINPNALGNIPLQLRKTFTSDSQIVFKFYLPDDPQIAHILAENLYIDNEVDMLNAFIQYLAYCPYAQNSLQTFVQNMPLLASCLQESSLSKFIEKPNFSYDMDYTPAFNYPDFSKSLSLESKQGHFTHYHDIDVNQNEESRNPEEENTIEINHTEEENNIEMNHTEEENNIEMNHTEKENNIEINHTEDENNIEINHIDDENNIEMNHTEEENSEIRSSVDSEETSKQSKFDLFDFSSDDIEKAVYQYEYILYAGGTLPRGPELKSAIKSNYFETCSEWHALASLKRLVLQNQRAFLLYAKPSLDVLHTEIKHSNDLTKQLTNRLISLLVICHIKLTHRNEPLTDEEEQFLSYDLYPKLKEILDKIPKKEPSNSDLPQILLPLLYTVLNAFNMDSNTRSSQILLDNLSLYKKSSSDMQTNVYSYIVPVTLAWDIIEKELNDEDIIELELKERRISEREFVELKGNLKITNQIQQSILLTTDEYSSKWLTKISLLGNLNYQNENFIKNILIPLILSSSKNAVDDFFLTMKEFQWDDIEQLLTEFSFYSQKVVYQTKNS